MRGVSKAAFRAKHAAKREASLARGKTSVRPHKEPQDPHAFRAGHGAALSVKPPPSLRYISPPRALPTSRAPTRVLPRLKIITCVRTPRSSSTRTWPTPTSNLQRRLAKRRSTIDRESRRNIFKDTGRISELRELFGMPPIGKSSQLLTRPKDAVLVSLDTEFERHGLIDRVKEVGLTILDTRDLVGLDPGLHARNWFAKSKTYQFIVARRDIVFRKTSQWSCLFSEDIIDHPNDIRRKVLGAIQSAATNTSDHEIDAATSRDVILVGQSINSDISKLSHDPAFHCNFLNPASVGFSIAKRYDTNSLAVAANSHGAKIRDGRLGPLVVRLGLEARYCRGKSAYGWHVAGNDAAYGMMALLAFAVDWDAIVEAGRRNAPPVATVKAPKRAVCSTRTELGVLGRLAQWLRLLIKRPA